MILSNLRDHMVKIHQEGSYVVWKFRRFFLIGVYDDVTKKRD